MIENKNKHVKQALLYNDEETFKILLETASVGIVMIDQQGHIVLVNTKTEELFGYQREELIGQTLEMLLPVRLRGGHIHHRADYFSEPRVRPMGVGLDLVARHKDGHEFPIETGLSYIKREEELLAVSFISDISQRKQAEAAKQRYAQRLESMREIDRAILMAHSSQEIAQVALTSLAKLVPSLCSCVMLFDFDAREALVLASLIEDGGQLTKDRYELALDSFQGLPRLKQNKYHIQRDVPALRHRIFDQAHLVGRIGSFLDVPLFSQGNLIGVLQLVGNKRAVFGAEEVEIACEVANQLAIGIQQAGLREGLEQQTAELSSRVEERTREIQKRREVAEGLRDLLTVLNSNRPLEDILEVIVTLATRLLASDATALFRVQTKTAPLRIVAAKGLCKSYVAQIEIPVGLGAVGQAVSQGKAIAASHLMTFLSADPALQNDAHLWAQLTQLAEQYHSLLAIPLIVKEEVYGSLVLYYTKQKDFDEEEIELAVAFCDQASLAIENARLRTQVKESAVTAERNRLARDLHDAVTQTLFSASLIAEVLPRLWEIKPEEGPKRLQELRELTRGALAEMRTLLFELRPTVLIKTALPDLLRQLGEATISRARIPVRVTVQGSHQLPPDVQVGLYRISQEALNNIAKHSAASQASVTLRMQSTVKQIKVELEICDNGRGFILADVAPERLGLDIMQERADNIGAILKIKSKLGQGTEIIVTWRGS